MEINPTYDHHDLVKSAAKQHIKWLVQVWCTSVDASW